MKIHLDNVNLSSRSGPNSFAKRMSSELTKMGHIVTTNDGPSCDVSLVFIEPTGNPLSKRVVHRLDGIWFSPEEFSTKNSGIKHVYDSADHVVWQSQFDKNMTTKWWGYPRAGTVVRNGTQRVYTKNESLESEFSKLRARYDKIFVCSANWHPQKRLRDNIELFSHLKKTYDRSCLLVLGSNPSLHREVRDVFFVGNIPHDECMQVYSSCDWMIHLAWLDHCPNTVVESLSCGTPVICSEDGGTAELVGGYGIVMKETDRYDYSLTHYDSPPELDVTRVSVLPPREDLGSPPDVTIETSVKKYLEIFESLQ